jgi:hypothetical protein
LNISGAIPILFDYHDNRLINHYLENTDKFDGMAVDPIVLSYKFRENKIFFPGIKEGLEISNVPFTYTEPVFPINKNKKKLRKDLNKYLSILKQQILPGNKISNIVKKYVVII